MPKEEFESDYRSIFLDHLFQFSKVIQNEIWIDNNKAVIGRYCIWRTPSMLYLVQLTSYDRRYLVIDNEQFTHQCVRGASIYRFHMPITLDPDQSDFNLMGNTALW